MEDFSIESVSKKSLTGFLALSSRTFFVKILGLITSFVLTIFLDRSSYGVYFIASSIVVFLVYFQDIGLAASLIQKKEKPTLEELRTTFTIQQILVLLIIIPSLYFSKYIANFYHLNTSGLYLLDALLISFFISSLKTIPTVLLERDLHFHKLVLPDIVENVSYNLLLVIFAVMGFGITSFTIAVVVRSILGLFVIYYIQPWEIGISLNFEVFKKLASFGLPFQANSLLALLKDNLVSLFIGKLLPFDQVGLVGFAQKISYLPSNLIMDNVIRVTFPSYSRLQHDKAGLKIVIEKSLFLIGLLIFPLVVLLIIFSGDFIKYVPIAHYQKWAPSVMSITFFSLNILFASITVPLTNFLNAIGKVKLTLYAMVLLTIFTWGLTPLFIFLYGFNGVAIASFIVAASLILILPFVKRQLEFSFVKPIIKPLVGALGLLALALTTTIFINSFMLLMFAVFFSGFVYLFIMYMLAKDDMKSIYSFSRNAIFKSK